MRIHRAALLGSTFLIACGSGNNSTQSKTPPPAAAAANPPSAQTSAAKHIDACALLTKPELEAIIGRPTMDGRKDDAAELSTCQYGNPAAPLINGNPTDILVNLSVFSGSVPGQARGVFDIAKKNAADVEAVNGLGDEAFWDKPVRAIHVVKGNYLVDVMVASDLGARKTVQPIAEKALARLP